MQITEKMLLEWQYCFPDVQIEQEIRLMEAWLQRNPSRRGTRRFVENWLKGEQRKKSEIYKESRVGSLERMKHV